MPQFPNILVHAIPGFVLLIVVEIIYAVKLRREFYEIKDTATSISLGLGNLLIGIVTKGFILLFFTWIYTYRFFTIPYNIWWAWVLCFFADDFSYYWFHRMAHSIRWFWASHVVHHSSEHYNLAAALRQTWTGNLTGAFIFWAWMPLVGFHPGMILLMQSVSLLYQFWIHTEAINKFPKWFEFIFNTPSHHRVHHGSDLLYLDKNHAGTLIIWDRIFKTFQPEIYTPTYGLTKNVKTFNPAKVAFHEWINIGKDLSKPKGLKHVLSYLFNAPGWSHDGSSKTTKELRKERK
ncbi:MAG: sterol desaturase family protein [Bacteroidetes bacterium]|nr:sterol desaturase family protein [Bacteroidota bacterium]